MIDPKPPIRRAAVADAAALAEFINFAGEGLPLYFWRQRARDGEMRRATENCAQERRLRGRRDRSIPRARKTRQCCFRTTEDPARSMEKKPNEYLDSMLSY
jgi:hypothetical protein